MHIRSGLVISLFSLSGLLACGGDDDGGGGGGAPSKSTKISDLSSAQAKTVCERIKGKADRAAVAGNKLECTGMALISNSGDEAACEADVEDCVDPDTTSDVDCEGDEGASAGTPPECEDLTVGDVEDCLDDNLKAIEDITKKFTCASELTDLAEIANVAETEACKNLAEVCPEFAATMTAP